MAVCLPLAQRKPGTHLHPELRNRSATAEYRPPDPALLARIATGLRNLKSGSP
jgi:hypothetical protein